MTNFRWALPIASATALVLGSWGVSASDPPAEEGRAGPRQADGKDEVPRRQARKRIRGERREAARRIAGLEGEIQALRAEMRSLTAELQAARRAGQPRVVAEAMPLEPPATDTPPGPPEETSGSPVVFPIAHYNNRDGGDLLLMASPDGGRVVLSNTKTGDAKALKLSGDEAHRHVIRPVSENAHSIVALGIRGPKITRLAVLSFHQPSTPGGSDDYSWYPIDLREPVDEAFPKVDDYVSAIYTLGRRVYAFSRPAGRWDVLELPEGSKTEAGYSHDGPNITTNGHVYTFVTSTGKWKDYNTRAAFDSQFKR